MSGLRRRLLLGLALAVVQLQPGARSWADCPVSCRCRWTSGKKSALCPDAGLAELPGSLDPDTQVIELSGNRIPELGPRAFKRANLLNLQRVFARAAGLERLDRDAFEDMGILVELDLSDNRLSELDERTFAHNERLKLLVLSGNPLGVLRDRQFPALPHLKTLELQRCKLREVHRLAFHKLVALETLSLDKNELEYLESETIEPLRRLKTLGLDSNPWSCDCRLREFSRLMTSGNRLYAVPQSCSGPTWLQGRRWEDVRTSEFACKPRVHLASGPSVHRDVGGNVSLSCLATGDPEPEVWWSQPLNASSHLQHSGQYRPDDLAHYAPHSVPSSGGIVVYSTSLETRRRLVERWSNLTIYNASELDAGKYSCNARNTAGTASRTAEVFVPGAASTYNLGSLGASSSSTDSAAQGSALDGWLLWLSLAAGGASGSGGALVAAAASGLVVVLALVCLCTAASGAGPGNGKRRRGRRHHHKAHRSKVKLQESASFGDQEKKLLDLSVTTTTSSTTTCTTASSQQSLPQLPPTPAPPPGHQPQPQHQGDYAEMLAAASPPPGAAGLVMIQQPPNGAGPYGVVQRGDFELDFDACSVQEYAHFRPLMAAAPPSVYVAVSLASAPGRASPGPDEPDGARRERCYPDLLDIGFSYATLPRRGAAGKQELGSPYDNMGPRVTATGSTLSLEQPGPQQHAARLKLCEPPLLANGSLGGIVGMVQPLIQPPPEFVSL